MRRTIYILFALLVVVGTGCSSKKSGGGSGGNNYTPPANGIPPVTDPDSGTTINTGAIADLVVSKPALDQYVGWTTNAPSDAQVVVSLSKVATYSKPGGGYNYSFGGYVSIKFKDSGRSYTDIFSSQYPGGYLNTVKDNTQNNQYNLLSSDYPGMDGAIAYHGFFEDTGMKKMVNPFPNQPLFGGAVILVIDSTNDLGDGQGPTSANGAVYFKNIISQYPMGGFPSTSCWFISAGPYDCRSWPSGNGVNTMAALHPNNGYVLLGRFTGLDMKAAFGQ